MLEYTFKFLLPNQKKLVWNQYKCEQIVNYLKQVMNHFKIAGYVHFFYFVFFLYFGVPGVTLATKTNL